MKQEGTTTSHERIVFFDGVCGLCNSSVDFLMPKDKNDRLLFATLQGATAENLLSVEDREDLDSMVYWKNGQTLKRSTAVLTILKDMGGPWSVLSAFLIVPGGIRDFFYNIMAKYRYKWFGKQETCRMPTEKERGKLLV